MSLVPRITLKMNQAAKTVVRGTFPPLVESARHFTLLFTYRLQVVSTIGERQKSAQKPRARTKFRGRERSVPSKSHACICPSLFVSRPNQGLLAVNFVCYHRFGNSNIIHRNDLSDSELNLTPQSFRYSGAITWNSLPSEAKQATTLRNFLQLLINLINY